MLSPQISISHYLKTIFKDKIQSPKSNLQNANEFFITSCERRLSFVTNTGHAKSSFCFEILFGYFTKFSSSFF